MIDLEPETITHVAIEYPEWTWSLPKPARHHDVIQWRKKVTGKSGSGMRQGFITSRGRFVDRVIGAEIAYMGKQIPHRKPNGKLYSEDIW